MGPNFLEEIDCGNFFDQMDDLLDFPTEELDSGLGGGGGAGGGSVDGNSFPSFWSTPSESLPGSESVFSGNSNSDLSAQLSVPYEDIVQLEWLSNFVEESFSACSLTINEKAETSLPIKTESQQSDNQQFRSSSPISVLESSSSSTGQQTMHRSLDHITTNKRGRARSKRPRPATFNPRQAIHLVSPTFEEQTLSKPPEGGRLVIKIPKQVPSEGKKKKRIKFSSPMGDGNENNQGVRKCLHCEITKTPQWRAGPMGPKTLCNACGVRYKSGRLCPEYRPAASPTFLPTIHSNSHKKVIEMRSKNNEDAIPVEQPELIPNNSNLRLSHM